MFALGIPKFHYRRTNDVLRHSLSDPITYDVDKQEDGLFIFSFPDMDEFLFKDVVMTLKHNGVTYLGADEQLTEKKIMKLKDLIFLGEAKGYKGDSPMPFRSNPDANDQWSKDQIAKDSATIKTVVNLKMDSDVGEPVTVEYKPGTNLTDVTISWGNESHTVDFEAGDQIEDHGNEGMDIETMADSDDGRWQFILDVQAEASFPMTGDFADWDFNELIVQHHPENEDHLDPEDRSDFEDEEVAADIAAAQDDIDTMAEGMMCEACGKVHEGTCGYGKNGKIGKKPAGPNMLQERFQKLAGIKSLSEQSFDDKLAQQMGMSDDEFEDQVASRDIGDDSFGSAGTDKRTQQVITDIIQLIKSTDIDPMDVMEVIGEEFDINFEFSGGAPGFKKAGTDAGFDMRGL